MGKLARHNRLRNAIYCAIRENADGMSVVDVRNALFEVRNAMNLQTAHAKETDK